MLKDVKAHIMRVGRGELSERTDPNFYLTQLMNTYKALDQFDSEFNGEEDMDEPIRPRTADDSGEQ